MLDPLWGRHMGDQVDHVSAFHLADFGVCHELVFRLPPDYYPPDHADFLFDGPHPVWTPRSGLRHHPRTRFPASFGSYLSDLFILNSPNGHEIVTGTIPMMAPSYIPATMIWNIMRVFKVSIPAITYLKDFLPDTDYTVVFRYTQSQFPIRRVVVDHWSIPAGPLGKRDVSVGTFQALDGLHAPRPSHWKLRDTPRC